MLRIDCPWCGSRDETEFRYRGDATGKRPGVDAKDGDHFQYVYIRGNPKGPHEEYWQHTHGCRRFLLVRRDTVTNHIVSTRFAKAFMAPDVQ